MNQIFFKNYLKRFVFITAFILFAALASGINILIEGWHLLVAPTITHENELAQSFKEYKYAYVESEDIQYTEIDMVFDLPFTQKQKKFNGYISKINEKYIFVFSQDNVDTQSKMIIMPSYFSEGNHTLFKESVYEELASQSDITTQEIRSMFISDVFVDVRGRIKEGRIAVILWIAGTLLGIVGFVIALLELNHLKNYSGKYAIFNNRKLNKISKNLLISDRGFIVMKWGAFVLSFDNIIDVEKQDNSIIIYFKKYRLYIKAEQDVIELIYNTISPEILTL